MPLSSDVIYASLALTINLNSQRASLNICFFVRNNFVLYTWNYMGPPTFDVDSHSTEQMEIRYLITINLHIWICLSLNRNKLTESFSELSWNGAIFFFRRTSSTSSTSSSCMSLLMLTWSSLQLEKKDEDKVRRRRIH